MAQRFQSPKLRNHNLNNVKSTTSLGQRSKPATSHNFKPVSGKEIKHKLTANGLNKDLSENKSQRNLSKLKQPTKIYKEEPAYQVK